MRIQDRPKQAIAYRIWTRPMKGRAAVIYYVAQVPGDAGVDWGYVTNMRQAKPLPPYWQQRFEADCRRVGANARFMTPVWQFLANKVTV